MNERWTVIDYEDSRIEELLGIDASLSGRRRCRVERPSRVVLVVDCCRAKSRRAVTGCLVPLKSEFIVSLTTDMEFIQRSALVGG